MKTFKLLFFFSLVFFPFSATMSQMHEPMGTYSVTHVQNDTLLRLDSRLYSGKFTAAKGYYYIDYTDLNATDGTIQFGVIITENGVEKFVALSDAIVLSNLHSLQTINGKQIYLFQTVDGVTTWQLACMFDMFPGEYPAILYTKNSADNGSFKYKVKILK